MHKHKKMLSIAVALLVLSSCDPVSISIQNSVASDYSSTSTSEEPISVVPDIDADLPDYEKVDRTADYIDDDNYRDFYHIFVHSFSDSDGDGVGDIRGIIDKLDYLRNEDDPHGYDSLGINGIFLSPVQYASSYHGYDIIDYEKIDPDFGTMADFDELLADCHERGIKLIMDLVLNHTSTTNEYFKQAKYALSTDVDKDDFDVDGRPTAGLLERHPEVGYFRFINKDYTFSQYTNRLYDTVGDWKFEGFSTSMPDWNLENPAVKTLHKEYMKFWLDKGIDGYRLDAVQSFFGEQTINKDMNYQYINFIDEYTKSINPDAYVIAEGPWSMSGCQSYIENTDVDSYFNFDTSYSNIASKKALYLNGLRDDDMSLSAIESFLRLEGTESELNPNHIDAYFNSNHDIGRLTNQFAYKGILFLKQLKFHIALQNMFKGNYFLYYGDEIGLCGIKFTDNDKPCRSPFLWGDEYETEELEPGLNDRAQQYFEAENIQKDDSNSLFNFVRRLFKVKEENPSIARGDSSYAYESEENEIITIDKTYNSNVTKLVISYGQQEKTVSQDSIAATGNIRNCLSTDGSYTSVTDGTLTLPALSITVIE